MTTIEREMTVRTTPHEPERPVFLAANGRRARRLRIAALAVTVLAVLWLVALAAGTLGFGSLPGFSVPQLANLGGGGTPPPPARGSEGDRSNSERGSAQPVSDATVQKTHTAAPPGVQSRAAAESRVGTDPAGKAKAVQRPVQRPNPVQPAVPAQPAQPQAAAPPLTGRERRGLSAPPGHARQLEPAPPPPGRRVGQETTTTPIAPPPPPPPGNGKGGGPKQ